MIGVGPAVVPNGRRGEVADRLAVAREDRVARLEVDRAAVDDAALDQVDAELAALALAGADASGDRQVADPVAAGTSSGRRPSVFRAVAEL